MNTIKSVKIYFLMVLALAARVSVDQTEIRTEEFSGMVAPVMKSLNASSADEVLDQVSDRFRERNRELMQVLGADNLLRSNEDLVFLVSHVCSARTQSHAIAVFEVEVYSRARDELLNQYCTMYDFIIEEGRWVIDSMPIPYNPEAFLQRTRSSLLPQNEDCP